jgi:hypothetical protein
MAKSCKGKRGGGKRGKSTSIEPWEMEAERAARAKKKGKK